MSNNSITNQTYYFFVLAVFVLSFLTIGCKKDEGAKNGLSGKVVVQNGSADGAIVCVYDIPSNTISNSAWYLTERTPQVGFRYSPQAAFDWRKYEPVDSFITGSDGDFEFPDLSENSYIIVARKTNGYGWTNPRVISVSGDNVDIGNMNLYPDSVFADNYTTNRNFTFLADHHYVFEGRFTVSSGDCVTVQPGAVVRIAVDQRITVNGTLKSQGTESNFITFTSNEVINPVPADWGYIKFENADSPPLFRYTRFEYCDDAIRSNVSGGLIEYCYFSQIQSQGTDITAGVITLRRNVIYGVYTGFRLTRVYDAVIEHNIFHSCSTFAVNLDILNFNEGTGSSLFCNLFYNCGKGDSTSRAGAIYLSDTHELDISRNEIQNSWFGLNLGSKVDSSTEIHLNFFNNIRNLIYLGVTEERRGPSYPWFHDNCMNAINGNFVQFTACQHNYHDIDCFNNYWGGGVNLAVLNVRTYDCEDGDNGCGCVNYEPLAANCPANARLCDN